MQSLKTLSELTGDMPPYLHLDLAITSVLSLTLFFLASSFPPKVQLSHVPKKRRRVPIRARLSAFLQAAFESPQILTLGSMLVIFNEGKLRRTS